MTGTMTSRMENAFKTQPCALITYLTIGDPDLEGSYQAIKAMAAAGADVIELGVPFTDPLADGPTIQKSSQRALQNNLTLDDIFTLARRLRDEGVETPFVLMSYANPVYRYGYEEFCKKAVASGLDAALITDLPPEEAEDYRACAQKAGLGTVFLCSPTTSPERLRLIDEASRSAFVYYVARAGVTGARAELPDDIKDKLQALRAGVKGRLCVGFGISTPAQARALAPYTDGLIIGSALVTLFEQYQGAELHRHLHDFIAGVKKAMNDV